MRDGDALDRDARERGTSVYFPRRVIPMLPEELSNELCSLKPARRPAVHGHATCPICAAAATSTSYRFYPAVMHSRARLTYTQVWDWLSQPKAAKKRGCQGAAPASRKRVRAVQGAGRRRARRRGAIDFETIELELKFDTHGKIEAIVPVVRNEAHKLIEECMLAANVCAAQYLLKQKHPALYRVHEGPTPEKLKALQGVPRRHRRCRSAAVTIPRPPTTRSCSGRSRAGPDFNLLQTVLLRSLQQAVYSPDNEGHFGLGYDAYTHFTSPIRRYPDLLMHRCDQGVSRRARAISRAARHGRSSACTAR